mmetsp:Transcript_38487/g.97667  ORF Transcript_38487/g.97667 Transcript_38487/m.97667 type:complete len:782 (+) Transcript_38487:30-2375(+)
MPHWGGAGRRQGWVARSAADGRQGAKCLGIRLGLLLRIIGDELLEATGDKIARQFHFLTSDEALQRGVHCQAKGSHEELRYNVTDEPEADAWQARGDVRVHPPHNEVAHDASGGADAEEADAVDDAAQRCDGAEAEGIPQDEEECSLRGGTEVLATQGDLDVGVLVQELDALLEDPDATLHDLQEEHQHPVLLGLGLLLKVIHAVPDELHHRDDERAKSHGADVVPEDSLDALQHRRGLPLLVLGQEEPSAARTRDDNLAQGDVEGIVPQEDEEGDGEAEVENVAGRCAPVALRHPVYDLANIVLPDGASGPLVRARAGLAVALLTELPDGARSGGAVGLGVGRVVSLGRVGVRHLRNQEGGAQEPQQAPNASERGLHDRNEQHAGVAGQEHGRHLVERNGQANAAHHADDDDHPDQAHDPNNEGRVVQGDAHLRVGDLIAVRAEGLDDANGEALLPRHVHIRGHAPDRLRVDRIAVVVWVAAEGGRPGRGVIEATGGVVRGVVHRHDRLIVPSQARFAAGGAALATTVVRAVQGRRQQLAGALNAVGLVFYRGMAGDDDCHGDLLTCPEDAGARALAAEHEYEGAADPEHQDGDAHREPHAKADGEAQDDQKEDAEKERQDGHHNEAVDGPLEVADPVAEILRGRSAHGGATHALEGAGRNVADRGHDFRPHLEGAVVGAGGDLLEVHAWHRHAEVLAVGADGFRQGLEGEGSRDHRLDGIHQGIAAIEQDAPGDVEVIVHGGLVGVAPSNVLGGIDRLEVDVARRQTDLVEVLRGLLPE